MCVCVFPVYLRERRWHYSNYSNHCLYLNFFSICFSQHKITQSLAAMNLQSEIKRRKYCRRFKQVLKKQAT